VRHIMTIAALAGIAAASGISAAHAAPLFQDGSGVSSGPADAGTGALDLGVAGKQRMATETDLTAKENKDQGLHDVVQGLLAP